MSSLPQVTKLVHNWDSNPNRADIRVPVPEAREIKRCQQVESYQVKRKGEETDVSFAIEICDGPPLRDLGQTFSDLLNKVSWEQQRDSWMLQSLSRVNLLSF